MSCYWGIHCKTCSLSSEYGYNHGVRIIEDMIKTAPVIRKLQQELQSGYFEPTFMADYEQIWQFALYHYHHELVPEDEYGRQQEVEKQ